LDSLRKKFGHRQIIIGFLPDRIYFNPSTFIFYTNLRKLPYQITGLGDSPVAGRDLKSCDVLLVKTAKLAVPWTSVYRDQFFDRLREKGPRGFGFGGMEKLSPA
jgi:hypothetical protein